MLAFSLNSNHLLKEKKKHAPLIKKRSMSKNAYRHTSLRSGKQVECISTYLTYRLAAHTAPHHSDPLAGNLTLFRNYTERFFNA